MIGYKFGSYIVLKQSGDKFECSNGKHVIKLFKEDIQAGNWSKGDLMFNLPQPEKKVVPKKTTAKKKPIKKKNVKKI